MYWTAALCGLFAPATFALKGPGEGALDNIDGPCPIGNEWNSARLWVEVNTNAPCDDVMAEMVARVAANQDGTWIEPQTAGNYTRLPDPQLGEQGYSDEGPQLLFKRLEGPLASWNIKASVADTVNSQTTDAGAVNPRTTGGSMGGELSLFTFLAADGGHCKVEGCSESVDLLMVDNNANYCAMRNLYCSEHLGCQTVLHDFTAGDFWIRQASQGAGRDASKCGTIPHFQ